MSTEQQPKKQKMKNKKSKSSSTLSIPPPKSDNKLHVQFTSQSSVIRKQFPATYDTLFSSSTPPETRSEIWSQVCGFGEALVNEYSWGVPDERALKIIKYYSTFESNKGVIEIGCGSNAYWGKLLKAREVDVVCFDADVIDGGRISKGDGGEGGKKKKDKKRKNIDSENNDNDKEDEFKPKRGGPEVLITPENANRVLFLCFPDESYQDSDESTPSLGASCLDAFTGTYIIHVGELFGDTVSDSQSPYGRSSSPDFQDRLYTEYHCILKCGLPTWPHANESLSVWKRTETCVMVFTGDSDEEEGEEEEDEEVVYFHVPEEERLPRDVAAKCAKFLLKHD